MPDHPNILFIFTDQQRADTMACYGNDLIGVPNLTHISHINPAWHAVISNIGDHCSRIVEHSSLS